MIIIPVDQLRDRHELIPLPLQRGNQRFQGFRRIFGTVMAEDNAAVAEMFMLRDRLDDGIHAVIFPVEGITIIYRGKDV